MKKLLPLFSCLLFIGCGEKSSSEGSQSTGENPTPSNDSAEPSVDVEKPPPVESAVAESPSGEPSESPNSLSDADVERLLKEAVDVESLEQRNDLFYQDDKPYSGWGKEMYVSGQVQALGQLKDGKMDGLVTLWHENGQKMREGTLKDSKPHGLLTEWHENGQKATEVTFKDGEYDGLWTEWYKNGQKRSEGAFKDGERDGLWTNWHPNGQRKSKAVYKDTRWASGRFWNSKGEEVETFAESEK